MRGLKRNAGDDGFAGVALDLDFEAFFLDFELGEFGSFHQINDRLDLLEIQRLALVRCGEVLR